MVTWEKGDHVEYESIHSPHVFYGVVEGFFGKDRDMAMCTDQTGRGSRPVAVKRLRRSTRPRWQTEMVA